MYSKIFKRGFDLLVSFLLFPLLLAVSVIIVPLIFIEDRGSPFYKATRMGRSGKMFAMYKFRSMHVNAPDIRNPDGSTYSADDDPRITGIGRLIRKTSIDELPQIINVMTGDMSIVGPRPTVITDAEYKTLDTTAKKRYSVRPGITGYSQAFFRNSISQEMKFCYDNFYVDHLTLLLDLRIIFKTFMSVIKSDNINSISDPGE